MRKLIALMWILLALPSNTWAFSVNDYSTQEMLQCDSYQVNSGVAVTDVNTQITFPRDTRAIYIENIGSTNELYFDPNDGVAAAGTSNDLLTAGKNRSLDGFKTNKIGLIASSGETTTAIVAVCL